MSTAAPLAYNRLVIRALFDENIKRRHARLAELSAHAEGRFECPDCGDQGPHEVQTYMGEQEFACSACGMQHRVPDLGGAS